MTLYTVVQFNTPFHRCVDRQHVLREVPCEVDGDGNSSRSKLSPCGHNSSNEWVAIGQRAREAANERVHGVVTWSASSHGAGQSQDAQFGDLEATGRRLEEAG